MGLVPEGELLSFLRNGSNFVEGDPQSVWYLSCFAAFLCEFVVGICPPCSPVAARAAQGTLLILQAQGSRAGSPTMLLCQRNGGKKDISCAASEEQSSLKWCDRRQEQAFESPEATECFVTARWLVKSHCSVEDVRADKAFLQKCVCILLLG